MKKAFSPRLLLLPLVPLYRLALSFHEMSLLFRKEPVRTLHFPVVSIGNLSTGGSGKTPLTIALVKALTNRGLRVDVLSRGYGRQSQLAARVQPEGTAEEFGDEPLLIARETGVPVYVAPQRFDAGRLAETEAEAAQLAPNPRLSGTGLSGSGQADQAPPEQKPATWPEATQEAEPVHPIPPMESEEKFQPGTPFSVAENTEAPLPGPFIHLLDDGFQHQQLARTVNILLLNRQDWRDWLLPAGNLREPLDAIRRASVIAIPADEPELELELHARGWQGPLWRLQRTMEVPHSKGPVAAFCGIARPQQFFAGLEAAGLKLALRLAFPDHFTYTPSVLEELLAKVRESKVTAIITTAKDLVRLGKLASLFPKSTPLIAAQLRTEIEDQDSVLDWLVDQVSNPPPRRE